jgi:hypothetical protein
MGNANVITPYTVPACLDRSCIRVSHASQVYRRVPVSVIGYKLATAHLQYGQYVCVSYFRGCVNMFALGGGVPSAAQIRDTPEHPYMERRM